jgi:hypothetical protein
MADGTRLNELAETIAALKKSVERIEDNQRDRRNIYADV